MIAQLRGAEGLDPELTTRRGAQLIVHGQYAGPDDPEAQRELRRIKELRFGGMPVFRNAVLLPPKVVAVDGSEPLWNLRRAVKADPYAAFTLQIAVYGRTDAVRPSERELRTFRATAEEAVKELRANGEDAYYYHGPQRSTVTVGLYEEGEHDASVLPPIESVRLTEARKRHPYNLVNGATLRETRKTSTGERVTLQPSLLVAAPRR